MHSKRQRGLALDKCVRIAKQISTRSFQCSCQGYRMVSWLLWLVPMLNHMLCAGRFYQVLNINLGLCVTYWLLFPCALSWAFFRFPIPFPHLSHYTAFILEYSEHQLCCCPFKTKISRWHVHFWCSDWNYHYFGLSIRLRVCTTLSVDIIIRMPFPATVFIHR